MSCNTKDTSEQTQRPTHKHIEIDKHPRKTHMQAQKHTHTKNKNTHTQHPPPRHKQNPRRSPPLIHPQGITSLHTKHQSYSVTEHAAGTLAEQRQTHENTQYNTNHCPPPPPLHLSLGDPRGEVRRSSGRSLVSYSQTFRG